MSQLKAAPLRTAKSAKALAKKKAILKTRAAIRWHEREREERRALGKERHKTAEFRASSNEFQANQIATRRRALQRVRDDWKMGPLRPNYAFGPHAELDGVATNSQTTNVEYPISMVKHFNRLREEKGQEPAYPCIVVDDKKYFQIAAGDRVVVIKGREKGKIGAVKTVIERSHQVEIEGINEHYADPRILAIGDTKEPARLTIPIDIDNVRLVIPYRITTAIGRHIYQDVIVDKMVMERHTTGIDPFTGVDYGNEEFPVEHRFDPETELPVFKRYIAGTRSVIPWPWEKDETMLEDDAAPATTEEKPGLLNRIRRLPKTLREQIAARRNAAAKEEEQRVAREAEELSLIDKDISEAQQGQSKLATKSKPNDKLETYDIDTGRNRSDPNDETLRNFYPTLVYPPFPSELSAELAPSIKEKRKELAKDDESAAAAGRQLTPREIRIHEQKLKALNAMKTPLQLRWEVQRAKQAAAKKEVDSERLLLALGQHMQKKGVRLTPQRKAAAEKTQIDVE